MNFDNIIEYEGNRNILKSYLSDKYDIGIYEFLLLLRVCELKREHITLKELKEVCTVDLPISPVISKLVSLKYFDKERLEEDERMVRVYNIDYFKIEDLIENIERFIYLSSKSSKSMVNN